MSSVSIQRFWALLLMLFLWTALLAAGAGAILTQSLPRSLPLLPQPARPAPIVPPRGAIYTADGEPLAFSLQNGERVYPLGFTAGQLVGYVKGKRDANGYINTLGESDAGQAGVEKAMEGRLARGEDVYLTINSKLQSFAEEALLRGVAESGAEWGTLIVMDSASGRVLALANAPAFDPGSPRGAPGEDPRLVNYAFQRLIEPGSTLKALTAAILIEQGAARMDDVVEAPMRKRIGTDYIGDAVQHPDRLSLEEVLAYSSNVGMSNFVSRIAPRTLYDYHQRLHLYDGRLLPGYGLWKPQYFKPEQIGEFEEATLSFGQGLSVTPMHLAAAFNTLSNDGVYVPPALTESSVSGRGERVFSAATAATVRQVLIRHNASRARLRGYPLGGKTGTAQINTGGGYKASDVYAALYAGFIPAGDSRATVLVVLYNPQTSSYGSIVAAPVFRDFAAHALAYWGVTPGSGKMASGE
ncbi:peptidoglycan D,D-transpeptidase FtsI family protein [Oceanithermus sp.]